MIDLHTHILPGVDDGVETVEEALDLARAAVADGIDVLAATPHVRDDYPTDAATMERLVGDLRAVLATEGIPLDLRPGGEIALDRLDRLSVEELRRFGLAGSDRHLLLEFPYFGWPLALDAQVGALQTRGITVVVAHPERNPEVQADPTQLRPLVEQGALVQLTAASLDGRLGRRARKTAHALIDLRLAHLIASDAHGASVRAVNMSAAAQAVADKRLARWLTEEVPGAIVSGGPLPRRPPSGRRRAFRLFRSTR